MENSYENTMVLGGTRAEHSKSNWESSVAKAQIIFLRALFKYKLDPTHALRTPHTHTAQTRLNHLY
jgi:hypothetical protein